jgi:hypothetical protein
MGNLLVEFSLVMMGKLTFWPNLRAPSQGYHTMTHQLEAPPQVGIVRASVLFVFFGSLAEHQIWSFLEFLGCQDS